MPYLSILWKALVLSFIINYLIVAAAPSDDNSGLATSDWGTEEEEEFMPSFLHVKKLFNEGKPFFVEKDPVSGQFDFNHKKSAGVVENYRSPAEELIPLRTNEITPNIHDFLHLPVKYSSSKSVYPLVSTSYASTKYQGSNNEKEGSQHQKDYTNLQEIQKRPNFFTANAILPFEKMTTTTPVPTTTTRTTTPETTVRTVPTVTTFKPSFPRRPQRPIPTRFQEPSSYWKRTEYPSTPSTPVPTTTQKFTPTIPTTTSVKTTYSPTIPPTTRKYFEPTPPSTPEKVPVTFITSTMAPSLAPASPSTVQQTTTTTTTKRPLVFPTESAVSLMEMLNNFADDSNPNVNAIQFNENAQPFQKPSGFRPQSQQQQFQPIKKDIVTTTTTTTTPRPLITNSRVNFNEYVKYDIQAPSMMSFHSNEPVSSINNIKISPDQNVASFVLGSKQSFGGSENSNDVQLQIAPQPAKVIGQVFNEPISGGAVSIRFPSKEEENRFENVPVITGAHKTIPNGHSAPFGFDPAKQRVSFPAPSSSGSINANGQVSQMQMVGTKIVFESNDEESVGNMNPFPTREVLPLKGNPNQRPIVTGEDQGLTPPEQQQQQPQRNRPAYPQKYFNEYSSSQGGPPPKNPQRPGHYDPNLPNILPQFRPQNQKSSHGPHHHQYKESGGYRQPYMPNPNRRVYPPGPPPPQGSQGPIRRNYQTNNGPSMGQQQPPMRQYNYQSNRFQSKMAPAPPPPPTKEQIDANRRMYKLPQTQPLYSNSPRINPHYPIQHQQTPQASDRIYNVRPQQNYYQDTTGVTPLNMENSNRFGQMDPLTLKNNFIEEDSYKMPPRQEVMPSGGNEKLEPVVTLQMIHTKKGGQGTKLSTLHADIPKNGIPSGPPVNSTDKPVYVVYPIHEKPAQPEQQHPVVIGQRGENGPAPPPELNVASGAYQNTPFTVIHHEQQPILTTLQKHLSVPKSPNRTNFPYQLEQPDPNSASELDSKTRRKDSYFPLQDSIYNIGEQPVAPQAVKPKILNKPDTISAKLPMIVNTERPAIAIAYTPSTKPPQTAQQQGGYYNHYSMPNYDSAVIPEILENYQSTPFKKDELDAAYPIASGGSLDYYQKDFQAPFHPSVNLGTISDSYSGWAILDRTTKRTNELSDKQPQQLPQVQQKNNNEIDRRDKNKDELIIGDFTTETKDPIVGDGFQPELEGGFMPIVPAHLIDVDHHQMAMKLDEDIPIAQKQVRARPQEIVMGKDTMVDISAEEEEEEAHVSMKFEESKPMMQVQKASMVVASNDEIEEEEVDEAEEKNQFQDQQQSVEEQEKIPQKEVQPQKMQEPERKPMQAMPAMEENSASSTTEKVMSLGDALSAIFGLSDEGFEEMTTKSQSNEVDMSRSS